MSSPSSDHVELVDPLVAAWNNDDLEAFTRHIDGNVKPEILIFVLTNPLDMTPNRRQMQRWTRIHLSWTFKIEASELIPGASQGISFLLYLLKIGQGPSSQLAIRSLSSLIFEGYEHVHPLTLFDMDTRSPNYKEIMTIICLNRQDLKRYLDNTVILLKTLSGKHRESEDQGASMRRLVVDECIRWTKQDGIRRLLEFRRIITDRNPNDPLLAFLPE